MRMRSIVSDLRPSPASCCGESEHMSIYALLIKLIPDSCINLRNSLQYQD